MSRPRINDPDSSKGLYRKFRVERLHPSKRHDKCRYFVLDIDHDGFAPQPLKEYADACQEEYPLLSKDIRAALDGDKTVFSNFDAAAPPAPDVEKLAREIANMVIGPLLHATGKVLTTDFLDEVAIETETVLRRSLQPPRLPANLEQLAQEFLANDECDVMDTHVIMAAFVRSLQPPAGTGREKALNG